MISYKEAVRILTTAARRRGVLPREAVPLAEAAGRVAAEAVRSSEALPPFDNSAMDGFAVLAKTTQGASPSTPVRFAVLGSSAAGDAPAKPKLALGAWEIMTGAPIPAGFDSIVKIEDVRVSDDGRTVELREPAEAGDHVRMRGADYEPDTLAFAAGTLLDTRHILALAALGLSSVPVRRRPKVAVLSTGRELVEPGANPKPGQIRNATASYLMASLPLLGAEARYLGICPDDPADFKRRVKAALAEEPDVLVTTGAVSMGRLDFVAAAIAELGAEILYHKVAIRPGKPGLAARLPNGTLLLGMPGNPISTVVGLRFFLAPYLRALSGLAPESPLPLKLTAGASKPEGLRCFFKARVAVSDTGTSVVVLPGQASFQIQPLLSANAWAVLPEEGTRVAAGTTVDVLPLFPGPADWQVQTSLVSAGSARQ